MWIANQGKYRYVTSEKLDSLTSIYDGVNLSKFFFTKGGIVFCFLSIQLILFEAPSQRYTIFYGPIY